MFCCQIILTPNYFILLPNYFSAKLLCCQIILPQNCFVAQLYNYQIALPPNYFASKLVGWPIIVPPNYLAAKLGSYRIFIRCILPLPLAFPWTFPSSTRWWSPAAWIRSSDTRPRPASRPRRAPPGQRWSRWVAKLETRTERCFNFFVNYCSWRIGPS